MNNTVGHQFPKILYLMGTGRSGTTILEILLSNNPGIFGSGEITYIFKDGFLNNEICSCGNHALDCSFWKNVYQRCNWKRTELTSINSLFREIEWHTGFPKLFLNLIPPKKMSRYRDLNQKLFEAVQTASGQNIIIDSSKYAGRGLALSSLFPEKVKILCLTRSPRGLLQAFQKEAAEEQKPKGLIATFLYDTYVLFCCRLVAIRTRQKICHIRYDDLMDDYVGVLYKIKNRLGLNFSAVQEKIEYHNLLDVGHIVTGNRLRKKGKVKFKPEQTAKSLIGFPEKIVVLIMNCVHFLLGF